MQAFETFVRNTMIYKKECNSSRMSKFIWNSFSFCTHIDCNMHAEWIFSFVSSLCFGTFQQQDIEVSWLGSFMLLGTNVVYRKLSDSSG